MKKVLIDTNIYSYAMKGDSETIAVLQQSHEIGICAVSIGELLSGFKGGNRELENRKELEEELHHFLKFSPCHRINYVEREWSAFQDYIKRFGVVWNRKSS